MPQEKSKGSYRHTNKAVSRPEAGIQESFLTRNGGTRIEASRLRYDSSIAPELVWDESSTRDRFDCLIEQAMGTKDLSVAKRTVRQLRAWTDPFLNWAGKAESESLDVEALPLFTHEKFSTEELIETLMRKRRNKQRMLELFGETERSLEEKVLGAYQHLNDWQNRLIFGDSLLVMNSLLNYESLGGSVQMVYMDPPYGVKFRGNFQPFIRKSKDSKGGDADVTREPEMIKAYRDTWSLGVHSWLTYMRNSLFLARRLLADTGSCFVQISDENVHLARCVMDEIFGPENFCKMIFFRTTAGDTSHMLPNMGDYILWYAKDVERVKAEKIFETKTIGRGAGERYQYVESPDKKTVRKLTDSEKFNPKTIPANCRVFASDNLKRQGYSPTATFSYNFNGVDHHPGPAHQWKTNLAGLEKLNEAGWLFVADNTLRYKRYFDDFPVTELGNMWHDTGGARNKVYVVQTAEKVVQRCMLMTTDPGDLVLDPTCGSGTTAYVAEQWGRRWVTCDTSRVPLALARQRLLTATFDYHQLRDREVGPRGGFVYKRKKTSSGEEAGGIVPHVTLESLVNDTPPPTEVLRDKPEKERHIVRVCSAFCVESLLPPTNSVGHSMPLVKSTDASIIRTKHIARMLEVLRLSPNLQLPKNQTIALEKIAPLANALSLHAEAVVAPPPPI